jgi:hypothetical protein
MEASLFVFQSHLGGSGLVLQVTTRRARLLDQSRLYADTAIPLESEVSLCSVAECTALLFADGVMLVLRVDLATNALHFAPLDHPTGGCAVGAVFGPMGRRCVVRWACGVWSGGRAVFGPMGRWCVVCVWMSGAGAEEVCAVVCCSHVKCTWCFA